MKKYIFDNFCKILLIIIIFILIYIYNSIYHKHYYKQVNRSKKINLNFEYTKYESHLITDKMKNKSSWELTKNEAFFINGIIRKHLPKNCLEIGVSRGGSSVLILNAIKDIKDSRLISIDLNNTYYKTEHEKTGWIVKSRFPELAENWSLYTGDQPHKFLMKLNLKFDFMFLDTAHISPGELFNIIEAMPFLNENAIIVLHDIFWHFHKLNKKTELEAKVNPPNLHIISYLYGDKLK